MSFVPMCKVNLVELYTVKVKVFALILNVLGTNPTKERQSNLEDKTISYVRYKMSDGWPHYLNRKHII